MTSHLYDAWQDGNALEPFDDVPPLRADRDAAVNTLRDVRGIAEGVETMPAAEALSRIARIARAALERLGGVQVEVETATITATIEEEDPPPL